MTTIKELLEREYNQGTRVTNCIAHMHIDLTKRPYDCLLCMYDIRNQLSLAISINEWLNKWKDDATEIFSELNIEKKCQA